MKINARNVEDPVYRLIQRGANKQRWNLFRLTLCFGVFAAPALSQVPGSQQQLPASENVYGTYNIQTSGDSGAVTTSSDQTSKTLREEWENSSWQLTFYKSGTANYVKTHVLAWTHELVYTQIFSTGDSGKKTTSTKTELFQDDPDVTATLAIQYFTLNGQNYRRLAMSNSEPTVDVKTTTTITTYDRNDHVTSLDIRPAPGEPFKADPLRMHLDLAEWQSAQWTNGYTGSISTLNNYSTYIAPVSKYHWLTLKAQWNLHK